MVCFRQTDRHTSLYLYLHIGQQHQKFILNIVLIFFSGSDLPFLVAPNRKKKNDVPADCHSMNVSVCLSIVGMIDKAQKSSSPDLLFKSFCHCYHHHHHHHPILCLPLIYFTQSVSTTESCFESYLWNASAPLPFGKHIFNNLHFLKNRLHCLLTRTVIGIAK